MNSLNLTSFVIFFLQAALPVGHRNQTVGAFFGPPPESTGSLSDSSDSEFREDDDSFSTNQLDDAAVDDDLISVGDLDPFSLTSSYSGEAESSDLEECTSDVIMKTFSSSNSEKMNDSVSFYRYYIILFDS